MKLSFVLLAWLWGQVKLEEYGVHPGNQANFCPALDMEGLCSSFAFEFVHCSSESEGNTGHLSHSVARTLSCIYVAGV